MQELLIYIISKTFQYLKNKMNLLTKSKYLIGLQCLKYLWIAIHQPNKIPEPDKQAQSKFDEGTKVGNLAKQWFPLGIDIPAEDFEENQKQTKELLKQRKPLFEAGFQVDELFSRADILNPINKNEWEIIEVKSGTEVKDINIDDVAFQKYIYEKSGLKVSKCYLMHINSEYVRKGDIDIKQLFILEDITSKVNENINLVPEKVKEMLEILKEKKCPNIHIHKNCNDPYECPLKECWGFLPEHNIFNLYRMGKKGFKLLEEGIQNIEDMPEDYKLNNNQKIQLQCAKTGKPNINKSGIKNFLNTLAYPLYFLDFETFNTVLPMFENTSPYQQIPFQFSLHVVKDKKSEPVHHEFLYDKKDDPRPAFLKELQKVLGTKGSIIVYNQSFEITRLKELALAFPEYSSWVPAVLSRINDLLIPFRNFSYYNPKQHGSASIKEVLPAIVGKSYKNMEINNGGDASLSFMEITYGNVKDSVKKKIRENLLKYCGLDSEGMVWIVEKLRKLI